MIMDMLWAAGIIDKCDILDNKSKLYSRHSCIILFVLFVCTTCEEMTDTNSIDTNINYNSQKLTYYGLMWPSYGIERKELSLFTRIDQSLSIKINFNLTGNKRNFLHCCTEIRNLQFPRMTSKLVAS